MSLMSWPRTGNNSHYFILDVPYLEDCVLDESLAFICGTCYYKETDKRDKFLKFPGITPVAIQHPEDTIQLETLFLNPSPQGTNDPCNRDMYRFASHPDAKGKLYSNSAISSIVGKISSVLIQLTGKPHVLKKISILFSRPHGPEQGLHVDGGCTQDVIAQEGDLLSVMVALMHDTKVDIATVNKGRKSFHIPRGAMIIMAGHCLHGGSLYLKCNARLHCEFLPYHGTNSDVNFPESTNTVGTRYSCPLEICRHRNGGNSFPSEKDLYNHWQNAHLKKKHVNVSLKKYLHMQNGGCLEICSTCGKCYKSKTLLARHQHHCE